MLCLSLMFPNCLSRAAGAHHTLHTLFADKSYGMGVRSVSRTIRPCLKVASSPVEVSNLLVVGLVLFCISVGSDNCSQSV